MSDGIKTMTGQLAQKTIRRHRTKWMPMTLTKFLNFHIAIFFIAIRTYVEPRHHWTSMLCLKSVVSSGSTKTVEKSLPGSAFDPS